MLYIVYVVCNSMWLNTEVYCSRFYKLKFIHACHGLAVGVVPKINKGLNMRLKHFVGISSQYQVDNALTLLIRGLPATLPQYSHTRICFVLSNAHKILIQRFMCFCYLRFILRNSLPNTNPPNAAKGLFVKYHQFSFLCKHPLINSLPAVAGILHLTWCW